MNDKQREILDFIRENDISDMSYREIARRLGIKNVQTVLYHLEQLEKKGLIYRDNDGRLKVSELNSFSVDNFFSIPIVGSANCGDALELAEEQIAGYLKISKKVLNNSDGNGLIALKAIGQSLNMANIFGDNVNEGDYLVVDCKKQPKNGDYVLSIIDRRANCKKFYKDNKEIRLISESTLDIPPIVLHEEDLETSGYLVNGVVIKVVKN